MSLKAALALGFVSATTLVSLDTGHCTVPRGNVISNKKMVLLLFRGKALESREVICCKLSKYCVLCKIVGLVRT